jgi:hypothetical protein
MRNKGKNPMPFPSNAINNLKPLSLSLMEVSSNVLVPPTVEEVIAFRGIPKASNGVRSSSRLESQLDADMHQMEKAMRQTQLRQATCGSGKPTTPNFYYEYSR